MISREQWEEGFKVEMEHKATYEWLQKYVQQHKGKLPPMEDFFLHIEMDHFKEDKEYYTKLKAAKL